MNKLQNIYPNIYCLGYTNKRSLGLAFIRFQEHYESPYFKNKVFTLNEYKKWYLKKFDCKKFDYWQIYDAFNLPDYIFNTFINGDFNPLTKNEKSFIKQIENIPKPFYVIGVNLNENNINIQLLHEVAHGIYYLDNQYKEEINRLIKLIPDDSLNNLHVKLNEFGYHPDTYNDEIQAYFVDKEMANWYGIDDNLFNMFCNTFKKHCDINALEKKFEILYN